MNFRYYIDPKTGAPHIHEHDVMEAEVEEVLLHPGENRPGRDGSRVAIGRTSEGRCLRIIYVPEPAGVFVVTAYDLVGKPLSAFRRRMRRRR